MTYMYVTGTKAFVVHVFYVVGSLNHLLLVLWKQFISFVDNLEMVCNDA